MSAENNKTLINRVPAWIKNKKFYIPALVLLLVIAGFAFFRGSGEGAFETEEVERRDISNIVTETGIVEAAKEVDLSFERSGRVTSIPVEEGQRVEEGDILVSLDGSDEFAGLLQARARVRAEEAKLSELISGGSENELRIAEASIETARRDLRSAEENLLITMRLEDTLVENARRNLYSSGLEAYLSEGTDSSSSGSFSQPEISGFYRDTQEGEYRIRLYASNSQSGYSFEFEGLESGIGTASSNGAEPLGTKGLFIEFPENFAASRSIEWVVPIPNIRSSSYPTLLNAYEAAIDTRESAVQTAGAKVRSAKSLLEEREANLDSIRDGARDEVVRSARASLDQAKAALSAAESLYAKTALTAPFPGVLVSVDVTEGEVVSPGVTAGSFISDASFEISVNISEADIAGVDVGDEAEVTFDAYDDASFEARVVSISPKARNVDGVASFETILQFVDSDDRIRAGLSADVDISAEKVEGVLAVPGRAVIERDGQNFVRVLRDDEIEEVPVTLGLRGSLGEVEVKQGLSEGDIVITFISEEALAELQGK